MIEWLGNIDASILLFIQEMLRKPFLNPIVEAVTILGNSAAIWVGISLILLFYPKTRKAGIASLLALVVSLIINNMILKNIIGRVRPYDMIDGLIPLINRPGDYSFPSGHTGSSFASAWVFHRRLPKWAGVTALILATMIGLSRLYLGVHYPTDVIFGVISGICCGCIADTAVKKKCEANGKTEKKEYKQDSKNS